MSTPIYFKPRINQYEDVLSGLTEFFTEKNPARKVLLIPALPELESTYVIWT